MFSICQTTEFSGRPKAVPLEQFPLCRSVAPNMRYLLKRRPAGCASATLAVKASAHHAPPQRVVTIPLHQPAVSIISPFASRAEAIDNCARFEHLILCSSNEAPVRGKRPGGCALEAVHHRRASTPARLRGCTQRESPNHWRSLPATKPASHCSRRMRMRPSRRSGTASTPGRTHGSRSSCAMPGTRGANAARRSRICRVKYP